MSWQLLSESVRPIRALSEWYASLPSLKNERPQDDAWKDELSRHMKGGTFIPQQACVATVEVDGITLKLNGQHTCAGFQQLNGSAKDFRVRYCHYRADDLESAADLYMLMDRHKQRSYSHLSNMYWDAVGLLEKYPKRILKLMACAANFDKGGAVTHNRKLVKGNDRIKLVPEYAQYLPLFAKCMGPAGNATRFMHREAVATAVLQTIKVNQGVSKIFWNEVETGEMLAPKSPTLKLRNYLQGTHSANGAGGRWAKYRKADFSEMYAKCIHAWNAYRANETTDLRYYPDAPLPKPR
jgi:hypothetical protein